MGTLVSAPEETALWKKTGDVVSQASLPVHVVIERLLWRSFQYFHSHVDRPYVAHVTHHARDLHSVGGGEVGV